MTKKTKMYVGVAVVAVAAYYLFMQSKKKKETTTASMTGGVLSPSMKFMTGGVEGPATRPFAEMDSTGQSKY